MKRYLPFILIVFVAAAALSSGFLIYRAKRAELTHVLADDKDEDKTAATQESTHMRGVGRASVTLEEFGDFQCPPCATLAATLTRIEHDYGDKLRVIFREFPLPMHVHAQEAASPPKLPDSRVASGKCTIFSTVIKLPGARLPR